MKKIKRRKKFFIKVNSYFLILSILLVLISIGLLSYHFYKNYNEKKYDQENKELVDEFIANYEDEVTNLEHENNESNEKTPQEKNSSTAVKKSNSKIIGVLEIPKLKLKKGFYSKTYYRNSINYGLQINKDGDYPDSNAPTIIGGHSGKCSICYFDKLYKLKNKDYAYIYYKNIKYKFMLVKKETVKKTGKIELHLPSQEKYLILYTCTNNSNKKQDVYYFKLESEE